MRPSPAAICQQESEKKVIIQPVRFQHRLKEVAFACLSSNRNKTKRQENQRLARLEYPTPRYHISLFLRLPVLASSSDSINITSPSLGRYYSPSS